MDNLAKRYEHIKLDKTCPVCGKPTPRLIPPADDDLPIGECCFSCFMAALDEQDFQIARPAQSPRLEAWNTLVELAHEAADDTEDITPITDSAEGDALMYGEDDSPEVEYIPFEDDGGEWDS